MDIRPLTTDDRPAIEALAATAEAEGFRFLTRFLQDLTRGDVRLDAPTEWFLGAFEGNVILAVGGVTADPYVPDRSVGRLRHLYVAAPHRRRGVGRELVVALERRAEGIYAQLRVRTDTAAAAQFYERLGYWPVTDTTATHSRALRTDFDAAAT